MATYIDPTTVVNPTTSSVADNQATGSYTAQAQHVIIDGKDFLIVDADSNGAAIYSINPTTGALITPPTYLNWTPQAGENETGYIDNYKFYTSPDGTLVRGFDADSTGVASLTYNTTTSTWSASYDIKSPTATDGGVAQNYAGFDTFKGADGNIYAYGSSTSDQIFTKYQYDWTTNKWAPTGTTYTSPLNTTDNNNAMKIVTAPDGTSYMVSYTFQNGTSDYTRIYKIDPATGDIVSGIRLPSTIFTSGTAGVLGAFTSGDITFDKFGHMVFSNSNGLQVLDPNTGTFLFQDLTAVSSMGTGFTYGTDIVYGDNGYVYVIGRDGNQSLRTIIYQIDASGNWSFVTQANDTTSTITWTGYSTGTFTESSNEVTTLSSGLHMIYTTQEAGANGPTTLIAGQISTIGELPPPVCFAAGTLIEVEDGKCKPAETLKVGDLVRTKDHGLKPILWIGVRTRTGIAARDRRNYPVRIRAGALGGGLPSEDLYVSQQHRILVKSKIAEKMFGTDEVLVAAAKLLEIDGVDLVEDLQEVTYVHFLFDQHEVVYSNGAETESLYLGPEAMKSLDGVARDEIMAMFPEVADLDFEAVSARFAPSGKLSKKLASRHVRNNRELMSHIDQAGLLRSSFSRAMGSVAQIR